MKEKNIEVGQATFRLLSTHTQSGSYPDSIFFPTYTEDYTCSYCALGIKPLDILHLLIKIHNSQDCCNNLGGKLLEV